MLLILRLIRESYLFAWQSLLVNKLRTTLSLLGITIGIFAVISVFTIVDSLEIKIRGTMESLGDNVVYVQKWPWAFGGDYPWWKYFQRPVPNIEDTKEIQKRSQCAETVGFLANTQRNVEFEGKQLNNTNVLVGSFEYKELMPFDLEEGRYFSEIEYASGKAIALIGCDIKKNLFGNSNAVGKKIKLDGRKVEVIGVFMREGSDMFGNSSDDKVLLPLNFARGLMNLKSDQMNPLILVKGKQHISLDEMVDELTGIMRSIRKLKPTAEDNFSINTTTMLSKNFDGIFGTLTIAGWFIGGLSLLVGGFGIANIMFVSVRERTHLIGIQKSLGAKNYFVLLQFLFESIFLSLFGGIIGLIIVFLIVLIVKAGFDFELVLTLNNIVIGLFVSLVIGFVAGMVPAWVASRLNPVDAIRSN